MQIVRKGAAVTVEIPEDLLRKANLAVGDAVEWALGPSGELALRLPGAGPAAQPDYDEWARSEVLAGLEEHEAGEGVGNEEVLAWQRSWGSEHELPPPLCD
jgi:antitoxin component of MazEF toxin-antitoxin module